MSFFELGAEERLGKKNRLLKLAELIHWESIRTKLVGLHKNEVSPKGGQYPYDPLILKLAIY